MAGGFVGNGYVEKTGKAPNSLGKVGEWKVGCTTLMNWRPCGRWR